MKKFIFTSVLAFLIVGGSALSAQNNPDGFIGLPGDNLNLFAVMNLFQESETLEVFEKSLNDPEIMINNLDLNGDNYVDYIMVHDYVEGNIHNIVLRIALNRDEFQDVAVFTVEKFRNGSVLVQLIGDEALYGPNYVIEPNYAERPNPGYRGNVVQQQSSASKHVTVIRTTYYDVASWPVVVYISRPSYRPWRSVWYWGYSPAYWHPWNPHYYHYYYGYHSQWTPHYVTYYRNWHRPRSVSYKSVYYTRIRNYSPTVVVNINKGSYKNTYSHPEKRREGEVLYSQRQSVGNRLPASKANVRPSEAVPRSSASSRTNSKAAQSNEDNNNASTVNTPRRATSSRQNVESIPDRTSKAPASPTRSRVATPRPASQPPRTKASPPAQNREKATAPNRTVQQPSPVKSKQAVRSAPASSNRDTSTSSREVKSQTQKPTKQSANSVRASENNSKSRSTQTDVKRNSSKPPEKRSAGSATKRRTLNDK